MRTRLAGFLAGLAAAVVVALAVLATPAGAQYVTNFLGRTFTSSAPSGVNGFALKTTGARLDLGPGNNDYLLAADVSTITTGGHFVVANGFRLSSWFPGINATGIYTCGASYEGTFLRQSGTGGTNTGSQTRLCVCVSDGAASPTYSWRNVVSGTAGNATTCNP